MDVESTLQVEALSTLAAVRRRFGAGCVRVPKLGVAMVMEYGCSSAVATSPSFLMPHFWNWWTYCRLL